MSRGERRRAAREATRPPITVAVAWVRPGGDLSLDALARGCHYALTRRVQTYDAEAVAWYCRRGDAALEHLGEIDRVTNDPRLRRHNDRMRAELRADGGHVVFAQVPEPPRA